MSMNHRLYANAAACGVAAIAMCGLTAASPASAAEAVALVMSVSGKVSPGVEAYSELTPEASIDLGADGRISFVHYPTCRQMTVVGGKVSFIPGEVQLQGGKVEHEAQQKCPKKMQLKVASGQAAAVVLRKLVVPAGNLAVRPSCVLTGKSARDYNMAQVTQNGKAVTSFKLSGPVITWPAKTAPLQSGLNYTLTLTSAKPGVQTVDVDFQAANDGAEQCQLATP
jgi:hypothetical protein